MGQLPPAFFDFVLSRNIASGVFLAACDNGDCRYRSGADRTEARITRQRDPRLRKRVDNRRIFRSWCDGPDYHPDIRKQLAEFRRSVPEAGASDT